MELPTQTVRILAAVGAAAAMLLAGYGVSALVDGDGPGRLPSEFGVAEPRIGDRAAYTLSVLHWSPDGAFHVLLEEERFSEFGWTGLDRMRDDRGVIHDTATLEHTKPLGGGGLPLQLNSTFHFDVSSREPVAWAFDSEVSNVLEGTTILGGPSSVLSQYDLRWRVFFDPVEPSLSNLVLDCGIRNTLQGERLDVRGGVALFPGCTMVALGSPVVVFPLLVQPTDMFHAVGWDHMAGRAALVMEGQTRFGRVLVWLAEDVPYPLQMSVQRSADQERYTVFRLAEYGRGSGTMQSVRPPLADSAPDHEWKTRGATGPSEVGVAHPFPLSEAYTHAMRDPAAADLRRFVQSDPDTYLAAAAYAEVRQDNSVHRRWDFALTDGDQWFPVGITRSDEPPAGISLLPMEPTQTTWRYDNASAARNLTMEADGTPRLPVPPSRVPATMPTVASQMERWSAYAGNGYAGRDPNWWSFQVRCKGNACQASELVVAAGYHSASVSVGLQGLVDGPSSVAQALSAMSVTYPIDGAAASIVEQPDRISYLLEFTQAPPATSARPATDPVAGAARAQPRGPGPAALVAPDHVLAGAAVTAVVASAAVWLVTGRRLATDEAARAVLRAAVATPGSTVGQIASVTGYSMGCVEARAAALVRRGRLVAIRRGDGHVFRQAPVNPP